jgi:protein SCO1
MADRSPDEVAGARRRWWLAPLAIGVAMGLVATAAVVALFDRGSQAALTPIDIPSSAQIAWAAGERPAPDFVLRDQSGVETSLSAFRGQPFVLTFLNSRCVLMCSISGHQLSALVSAFPADQRPTVVAISVSPEDTPASVALAANSWGWQHLRFRWLLGSREDLEPVWAAYGIHASRPDDANQVQHTGAVFVIDGAGDVRSAFTTPIPMPMLVGAIRALQQG